MSKQLNFDENETPGGGIDAPVSSLTLVCNVYRVY